MNKNNIIGFVLIGVIMFGFSWYQSKQYNKQMEIQNQLDSIAFVEQMAAMANDSIVKEENVVVKTMPAYKDGMLTEARLAEAQVYKLSNDKIEVEFTTRGAQVHSVKINDYMTYDSTALYLIQPEQSQYNVSIYAGENVNTKEFVFNVVEHNDSLIVMQLPFAQGGYIQQVYALSEGSYMVQNELSFVGMENLIPRNVSMLDIDWNVVIPRLEKGYKNEKQYSKLNYYFTGDKKGSITFHYMFQATECPGPHIKNNIKNIITMINNELCIEQKPVNMPKPDTSYKVKVTANCLNIRAGAGTKYKVVGTITDHGVYTIVETNGNWGKLKSGKGFIYLKGYTKKV